MAYLKKAKAAQGRKLLKAIFFELCKPEQREEFCSFTLKDEEHEGYPSLKQLYLGFSDPTEYEFAITVFGNYGHWKALCACEWFIPYIEEWREELEVALTSRAIKTIAKHAVDDKGFQAAKWIAERQYKKKEAGRKTTAQKERDNRINEKVDEELAADYKRLNLKAVK